LQNLEKKGLKVRHNVKLNGELEFFVTLQDELGGCDVQQVQKSLEDKMESFLIKGQSENNKVLVPLNADGDIIYSSTEFSDGAKKNPTYDYSSPSIRKFAIILTQNNADKLLTLNEDQINLLKTEDALPHPAPVAAPAPAPRAAAPLAPAPRAAAPPAVAPAPADAQNHGEILKQKIIGGAVLGAVGVGGVLLCASALGVGIVSAPVIGTAIGVGVAGALVGSVVAKPIADSITSCLSKKSNSLQV
jgi:hypothetical protein